MKNCIYKGKYGLDDFFLKESKVLETIFIITWLSLDDLKEDELYEDEVRLKWFPFDTLLWVLMQKYDHSETIYNICREKKYNSLLERLLALKEYLAETNTIKWTISKKVKLVLIKK